MTVGRWSDLCSVSNLTSCCNAGVTAASVGNKQVVAHSTGTKLHSRIQHRRGIEMKKEEKKQNNKRRHRRSSAMLLGNLNVNERPPSPSRSNILEIPTSSLSDIVAQIQAEENSESSFKVSEQDYTRALSTSPPPPATPSPTRKLTSDEASLSTLSSILTGDSVTIRNNPRSTVLVKFHKRSEKALGLPALSSSPLASALIVDEDTMDLEEIQRLPSAISFAPEATVVEIPSKECYTTEQRSLMWNGADAIRTMAQKNTVEYLWEGGNWREAVEEEAFVSIHGPGGDKVHPAHITLNHNAMVEQQQNLCSNSSKVMMMDCEYHRQPTRHEHRWEFESDGSFATNATSAFPEEQKGRHMMAVHCGFHVET